MNDLADETARGDAPRSAESASADDELIALLGELRAFEQGMPSSVRDKFALLLDPRNISHATGIEPDRVTALLGGAAPDQNQDGSAEGAQERRLNRLVFLRNTRLKQPKPSRLSSRTRPPRPYFYSEIARGVQKQGGKLSKQTVHYIFAEGRQPSPENLAYMERFFGVLPGFCSYTESEALVACLRPVVQQLRILSKVAATAALGVERIAARSAEDLSGNLDAMAEILTAVLDTEILAAAPDADRQPGP